MTDSDASAANGRARLVITARVVGFLAVYFLTLVGLRHVTLSGLGSASPVIAALILSVVVVLTIIALQRWHGGTFKAVGIRLSGLDLRQCLQGIGLGLVVVAAMLTVLILLTPVDIETVADSNVLTVLLISFGILTVLAVMEELTFRTYALFELKKAWGIRPAIYLTAIVFAFYHGLDWNNLLGPGVWGLLYGWMALKTGSIALPTGFHIGLNWMQALVGMKPKYGDSIWELLISDKSGYIQTEVVGVAMQIVLLVIGVILVERLARQQRS